MWLILKMIFGSLFSGLSSIKDFLFTYPKQAFAIALLAAALFAGWRVKENFDELHTELTNSQAQVTQLVKEKAQLVKDVQTAVDVNKQNQEVINKLSLEQVDAQKQIQELSKQHQSNTQFIEKVRTNIREASPQEDGVVAKVLRDTIDAIQKERAK